MPAAQPLVRFLRERLGQTLTPELAVEILLRSMPTASAIDITRFAPETFGELTFHAERIAGLVDEIRPLHLAHWQETEAHRHGLPFNPDYDSFIRDERAGRYLLFTARHKDDGRLLGNCACYVYRSTHTQTPAAVEDTMFLLPQARKGRTAIKFFQYAERCLVSLGVRELRVSVKHTNKAGLLWARIGYKSAATEFVKIID